jgi:CubicO group peptidase (beta-lactamase class C family)
LLSYTQKNLFDPLGITPEVWAQDLNGYYLGDGELRLRPQDLAKFGLLILRGGKWDGKSVVSTEWVRNATAIQVPEARGPHTSYGFQFWVINVGGHRVIKAAGYGGQRCWIIPSLDMVVVITSEPLTPDNDPDAILGQWIIPSVERSEDEKVKVFDK